MTEKIEELEQRIEDLCAHIKRLENDLDAVTERVYNKEYIYSTLQNAIREIQEHIAKGEGVPVGMLFDGYR